VAIEKTAPDIEYECIVLVDDLGHSVDLFPLIGLLHLLNNNNNNNNN